MLTLNMFCNTAVCHHIYGVGSDADPKYDIRVLNQTDWRFFNALFLLFELD
jgi:hypothetical protein